MHGTRAALFCSSDGFSGEMGFSAFLQLSPKDPLSVPANGSGCSGSAFGPLVPGKMVLTVPVSASNPVPAPSCACQQRTGSESPNQSSIDMLEVFFWESLGICLQKVVNRQPNDPNHNHIQCWVYLAAPHVFCLAYPMDCPLHCQKQKARWVFHLMCYQCRFDAPSDAKPSSKPPSNRLQGFGRSCYGSIPEDCVLWWKL